jgi:hypothetical protein
MKNIVLKSALVLFLSLATFSVAKPQAALLVLILGDKVASEEFHLSVDAGLNVSSMPGLKGQNPTYGFYFGLGTFIKINDKWALTPEFKPVSPRGAKNVSPLNDYSSVLTDVNYEFDLNYIDVPILVQYKLTPKLFFSTGPQFSFLTHAYQISTGKLPLGTTVKVKEDVKSNFESFNFSIPVELGYSLASARKGKGAHLKLRYNVGLTEMLSNSAYGSSNGSTFQLFLAFPFITPTEEIKTEDK